LFTEILDFKDLMNDVIELFKNGFEDVKNNMMSITKIKDGFNNFKDTFSEVIGGFKSSFEIAASNI